MSDEKHEQRAREWLDDEWFVDCKEYECGLCSAAWGALESRVVARVASLLAAVERETRASIAGRLRRHAEMIEGLARIAEDDGEDCTEHCAASRVLREEADAIEGSGDGGR